MIHIDDFKRPDGQIDMIAYYLAQQLAGERCPRCKTYQVPRIQTPGICAQCKRLDTDERTVRHDNRARCPECRHQIDLKETLEANPQFFKAGEHRLTCPACGAFYYIETVVHHQFESQPWNQEQEG